MPSEANPITEAESYPGKRPAVLIHAEQCKGCGRCVVACPGGVLGMSSRHNHNSFRYVEVVKPDACIGCGLCFYACPEPDAVTVFRKEKKEVPIDVP